MRPKGSADLISDRRRRAMELLDAGLSLNEVGRRIGCEPSSVMRWRNAVDVGDVLTAGQRIEKSVGLKQTLLAVRDGDRVALIPPVSGGA